MGHWGKLSFSKGTASPAGGGGEGGAGRGGGGGIGRRQRGGVGGAGGGGAGGEKRGEKAAVGTGGPGREARQKPRRGRASSVWAFQAEVRADCARQAVALWNLPSRTKTSPS